MNNRRVCNCANRRTWHVYGRADRRTWQTKSLNRINKHGVRGSRTLITFEIPYAVKSCEREARVEFFDIMTSEPHQNMGGGGSMISEHHQKYWGGELNDIRDPTQIVEAQLYPSPTNISGGSVMLSEPHQKQLGGGGGG